MPSAPGRRLLPLDGLYSALQVYTLSCLTMTVAAGSWEEPVERLVTKAIVYYGNILIALGLIVLLSTSTAWLRSRDFGKINLIQEKEGKRSFSWKTRLAYYTDCASIVHQAYELSKKGIPVWVPGLGPRKEIIMPRKDLNGLFSLPQTKLSSRHAYNKINCVGRGLGKDKYMLDNWQGTIVATDLNKVLDRIVISMNEELKYAMEARFGTSSEWKELDIAETMQMVVVQATSRFQVGITLCRDPDYLDRVVQVMNEFLINGFILGVTPSFLQGLVAPFSSWRLRSIIGKVRTQLKPLFEERLKTLNYEPDDPNHEEPCDYFQVLIRFAHKHRPEELNLHDITNRLCIANFEAIHQTSIALANMVLNILASDPHYDTIETLRNEVVTHLGTEEPGDSAKWTKAKAAKLVKADSIARESLRLHGFMSRGLFRQVMVDGLKTDSGVELPKGSILAWPLQPVHTDSEIFTDPLEFDPWRFSRIRENAKSEHENQTNSFVSTTQVLSFGRGRNACPGRWLVDFEVKMIISYMLLNYEVKFPNHYMGQRPRNSWFAEAYVLPKEARMLVRRRD